MKRIALLLGLAIILATCAQAATTPAKAAAAPSSTKMYIGVMNKNISGVGVNCPFIGFQINPDMSIDIGLTLVSQSTGGATNSMFGLFGRVNGVLAEISKVKVGWMGALNIGSTSPAGGTSTTAISLAGALSAEYMITDSLSMFGDANLLQFGSASTGGTSSTDIRLMSSDPLCISGFRVYL
jgi:hypothetical protein